MDISWRGVVRDAIRMLVFGFIGVILVYGTIQWTTAYLNARSKTVEETQPIILQVTIECDCEHKTEEYILDPEPQAYIPQYGFTEEDIYLLAQLLCGSADIEGDGEYDFVYSVVTYDETNWAEINKVLCVVMNRVMSDQFPDTVEEVVMQKGQFVVMPANAKKIPSEVAIETVREWCEAYDRGEGWCQTVPASHLYFRSGPNLTNVTREG